MKYCKRFIQTLIVLLFLPGCGASDSKKQTSNNTESEIGYFSGEEEILFAGFFGKRYKQYQSEEYSTQMSAWLTKRPLYKDSRAFFSDRQNNPKTGVLQSLCNQYSLSRILYFTTTPALQAHLFVIDSTRNQSSTLYLTSVPQLPSSDDLLLTMGALDRILQPASRIITSDGNRGMVVLARTAPKVRFLQFVILSEKEINKSSTLIARVIDRLSSTVVQIMVPGQKGLLYKGDRAFPILISRQIKQLARKHRKTLSESLLTRLPGVFQKKGRSNFLPGHFLNRLNSLRDRSRIYGGTGNEDR